MPLRQRLALVFALATAALIAVIGIGFLLQLRASLDAALDVQLRGRADTFADHYAVGGMAGLRLDQEDDPVQVVSPDGRVYDSSPQLRKPMVLDAAQRRHVLGGGALSVSGSPGHAGTRFLVTRLSAGHRTMPARLLVVGTSARVARAAEEHVEKALVAFGPPTVLAAGLAAWWAAGAALRPVELMRRQAADISEDSDHVQLAVPGTRDEIAALAVTMNTLLGRLRAAVEHERGFVADAGHELRTPLATLRTELDLAARPGRGLEDLQAAVAAAGDETDRLVRLAEDLLLLARVQGDRTGSAFLRYDDIDLVRLAGTAARAAGAHADLRGVDIVVDGPGELRVRADPDRLRQAIDNVVANAVRHSPAGGLVVITLTAPGESAPGRVSLIITDQGAGFPPEFLPYAFERFRRADTARARTGGGSGLGLAIVAAIVHAHDGCVRAGNRAGGGAVITIELPTGA